MQCLQISWGALQTIFYLFISKKDLAKLYSKISTKYLRKIELYCNFGILQLGLANSFWHHVIQISFTVMHFQNIYSQGSNSYFQGTYTVGMSNVAFYI